MTPPRTTYQLWIWLDRPLRTAVGRLGVCAFPRGWYAYTGSARGGPAARIRRHCRDAADKRLRWHINCFLAVPETRILYVSVSEQPECSLNAATGGQVVCPGLGASDCRAGCSSHLRYLGKG
ncbi:MAG TPA: GIY-YIG nuclease family protein, partial [Gammaproteobacteria bacterium]|nr:GIY-YIG nuclease family protein [Gammaproteobacteria bacterium]